MDSWALLYRAVQAYVLALFVVGLGTVGWLLSPRLARTPGMAGVWFGVGGFGALLAVALLAIASRRG